MAKKPWEQQPQRTVGNPHQQFSPDVVMVIKSETSTGKIIVESGNGKQLNPLGVISLCLSVAQGNLQTVAQQQSMLINPHNGQPAPHERTLNNPLHNFVACPDDATKTICSYCGAHKGNHLHEFAPVTDQDVCWCGGGKENAVHVQVQ